MHNEMPLYAKPVRENMKLDHPESGDYILKFNVGDSNDKKILGRDIKLKNTNLYCVSFKFASVTRKPSISLKSTCGNYRVDVL